MHLLCRGESLEHRSSACSRVCAMRQGKRRCAIIAFSKKVAPGSPAGPLFRPSRRPSRLIPGLPLTLGYTLFYLSVLVLIPLAGLVLKTTALTWSEFWQTITDPIVVASFQLTFGASAIAAAINGVFGLI